MAKDDQTPGRREARSERTEARKGARDARREAKAEAREVRRGRPPAEPDERKDKILHARIPEKLEAQLKQEARKMRIPVSNLVRNILEDTFHLVDDIVADSFEIVDTVRRDALHIAETAARTYGALGGKKARPETPGAPAAPEEAPAGPSEPAPEAPGEGEADPFADIYGWQELRLSRPAPCAKCGAELEKGASAFLGQSDDPAAPRRWLCPACMEA